MTLDDRTCYEAMSARDSRFDGVFFVAVSSTGVYCRPVCSARTPRRDRCRFYRTSAEAERAGYRACLRCRPEVAPGGAPMDSVPRLVAAAVRRIAEGFLNDGTVDDLARQLGITSRHLRRAIETELGVSPVELAQTRRLALAKQLLHDTRLGLADVAFASGFQSVRRFNALFQARFGRTPSSLRRELGDARAPAARARAKEAPAAGIVLRLDYRPPLDWLALLEFLRRRAIPGVEEVGDGFYRRTVKLGDETGTVLVRPDPRRPAMIAEVSASLSGSLMPLAARLRALLDLDAHPMRIADHLARDPWLAPRVRARPGLRVPGAFDPFEMTVRAVLGQQVTVRAATTLAGRIAARFGEPLAEPHPPLTRLFPSPATLAAATVGEIASLGITGARARCLRAMASAVADGTLRFDRPADPEDVVRELGELPGFGPWTSQYVALRALRWPDAFPAGDLGVRQALGGVTAADAAKRAEAWRPWRSYAVLHLWSSLAQ